MKIALIIALALFTYGCDAHRGTPFDPNEQQGNPDAHPEESIGERSNKQPDADKAGKDPHTLTPSRAGAEQ